jgi:hypothetical protein
MLTLLNYLIDAVLAIWFGMIIAVIAFGVPLSVGFLLSHLLLKLYRKIKPDQRPPL